MIISFCTEIHAGLFNMVIDALKSFQIGLFDLDHNESNT